MDGTFAFGAVLVGRCSRVRDRRARESWRPRIDHRRAHLADKSRDDRKGPSDRDRGALRVPLRARDHFLVELVDRAAFAVADLDSTVGFSWARLAGERPDAACLLLRRCPGCALAKQTVATAVSSRPFRRPSHHARNILRMGDSLPRNDGARATDEQMVGPVCWASHRRVFQAGRVDSDPAARFSLLSSVAVVFASRAVQQISA